jgi:acyl-CoA synthetase (AMP-forming)/AMP-acid ligase II
MPFAERLRSQFVEARAAARMARHLPVLFPGVRGSGALFLEENRKHLPDRTAILFEDERYTWADFDARANAYARFFARQGVGPGDAVALFMDNRPEYLFALMGLSKLRAVAACLNTHVTGSALAHAVRIGEPKFILAGTEHADAISRTVEGGAEPAVRVLLLGSPSDAPDAATVDDDIARESQTPVTPHDPKNTEPGMFLYTSGTTGLPKAAIVTNQRFLAAAFGFGEILHEATSEDVIYVCLPLYHGTAQWGGFGASLVTGAAIALRRKFSASNFWSDVVRFGATRAVYIGELCRYLLLQSEHPDERSHRLQSMTGNGLRKDVWVPFQERFGIPIIREFYGATEGNAPLANLEGRPGMIGRIARGQALVRCNLETGLVERDRRGRAVRVDRPGETGLFIGRISRLRRFDGYVDARSTESKVLHDVFKRGDSWFNSGDLMTLHEDDWLSFADRVGDTFRWKGENVSTGEVSLALNRAPGVVESIVYGVTVPGHEGRAGMACLRTSVPLDLEAFREHTEKELPNYARPLFLRLESELRTTSTFKHQRGDYVTEGYDPEKVKEPVFALVDGRYLRVDKSLFEGVRSGDIVPGGSRISRG